MHIIQTIELLYKILNFNEAFCSIVSNIFRYGVLPESLKPNKKVKSAVKRADSSSEEEDQEDRELKVMAEVKK